MVGSLTCPQILDLGGNDLLSYNKNYCRKMFYSIGLRHEKIVFETVLKTCLLPQRSLKYKTVNKTKLQTDIFVVFNIDTREPLPKGKDQYW
jgi:hypothetical protein